MDTANKFSNLKALLYEKYSNKKKKKLTKESKTNLNNVSLVGKKGIAL